MERRYAGVIHRVVRFAGKGGRRKIMTWNEALRLAAATDSDVGALYRSIYCTAIAAAASQRKCRHLSIANELSSCMMIAAKCGARQFQSTI